MKDLPTLFQKLNTFAGEIPDKVALSWTGGQLNYGQLICAVIEARNLLIEQHPTGTYVYLVSLRHGGLVAFLLAGLSLGRTVAILDPRSKSDRLLYCADNGLSGVWVIDELLTTTRNEIENKSTAPVILTSSSHLSLSADDASALLPADTQGKLVIFTSGSTGDPKGVLIDQAELEQRIETELNWFGISPGVPILGALPLNFDVGLTQLFTSLWVGAEHHFLESWLPNDILSAVEQLAPQGLALSPMVWRLLLGAQQKERFWPILNGLNYITLSGGDLAPDLLQTIASNLTRTKFFKTYGQSEFFRIASLPVNIYPEKLTSVGHAYPGVMIEIRDSDGNLCPAGKVGEVFSSGNGRMNGYLQRGQYLPVNNNEPHATGDLGFLDAEGFLTICGRKDEMIKILDQRIFPKDIANSIDAALGIKGTEVIALKTGQDYQLAAFICPPLQVSEQQVINTLRKSLTNYMVPKQVIYVEQWPTTSSGKLDKQSLASLADQQQSKKIANEAETRVTGGRA